jgi:hypothetical protein
VLLLGGGAKREEPALHRAQCGAPDTPRRRRRWSLRMDFASLWRGQHRHDVERAAAVGTGDADRRDSWRIFLGLSVVFGMGHGVPLKRET